MGQLAAQNRHCHQTILQRRRQMEEHYVAVILSRFVDRGHIVVHRVAHLVGRCGFDEKPHSTAHGRTVVNNKESGPLQGWSWARKPTTGHVSSLRGVVALGSFSARNVVHHHRQAPGLNSFGSTRT